MAELKLGWPNWIGIVAGDMEAQRRFYRDVLGLEELDAGEDWIQFDMGSGRLFELLALDPQQPQYDGVRCQVGFTVDDIRSAADELGTRGVQQISEIEGGPNSGQYWCYFRDPEGNVFELTQQI